MEKGYCEFCDRLVEYHIDECDDILEVKGKKFNYKRIAGYCNKCNNEISSNQILDENSKRMNDSFRNAEGIIKIEEIKEILQKYNIGKKPLAQLLCWGDTTILRYIDGDIPTKPYSDELYKLLNDTNYMREVLNKNKEKLTKNAYAKVKKSIENLQNSSNVYDKSSIELIAKYIIYKGVGLTPLALQKILYYVQGFYKCFFDKYLFNDDCEAWIHGPVYINVYKKYKDYSFNEICLDKQDNDYDALGETEKELIDVIVSSFGYYNGKALEKMTHYETPWIKARSGLENEQKSNNIIKKEDIEQYFNNVKEKYNMINVLDINKYSQEHFNRVTNI